MRLAAKHGEVSRTGVHFAEDSETGVPTGQLAVPQIMRLKSTNSVRMYMRGDKPRGVIFHILQSH